MTTSVPPHQINSADVVRITEAGLAYRAGGTLHVIDFVHNRAAYVALRNAERTGHAGRRPITEYDTIAVALRDTTDGSPSLYFPGDTLAIVFTHARGWTRFVEPTPIQRLMQMHTQIRRVGWNTVDGS